MKKFFLGLLMNSRQREIVWNAIVFSAHTYLRRGNTTQAANVQTVMNEVGPMFGVKTVYTKDQVDKLLEQASKETREAMEQALDKAKKVAFQAGFESALDGIISGEVKVGVVNIEPKQQEQETEGDQQQEAPAEAPEGEGTGEGENAGEQAVEGTEAVGTATTERNEE